MTMYWGVKLSPESAFGNPTVIEQLANNPELIKLEKIHTTLLFVGKKENSDEEIVRPFEGKLCKLTIDAIGCSANACALRVKRITYDNDGEETDVPSPNGVGKTQHVTMALAKGHAAKDSVDSLVVETTIELDTPFELFGAVFRYRY